MNQKITTKNEIEEDASSDSIRPLYLNDFIGQGSVKKNLKIFIDAAKGRGESLDHVLLYGPPGLGKTTMAQITAKEMGVGFRATSGPILTKAGDLAAILTNLQAGDILFIDEIHRLNSLVEEVLYPAIEDFKLDLIIGEGPAARTVRIDLPQFTLVGATTRLGIISNPLRDRFGIQLQMEFYSSGELREVIKRGAKIMDIGITSDGADEIAKRSRGTPRIAVRLLKRVRDFVEVSGKNEIDKSEAHSSLQQLGVDERGLDKADRRYIRYIAEHYRGGPVGVETIAAALSEKKDVVEETIEPYLIQIGFLGRTPRGRVITKDAFSHIGIVVNESDSLI